MYLVAVIGRGGLPYAIGALAILAAFVIVLVLKRTFTLSKSARQEEDAEAQKIIVRDAELAGWGPPERKRMYQHPENAEEAQKELGTHWVVPPNSVLLAATHDRGDHPRSTLCAAPKGPWQACVDSRLAAEAPRGAGARHPRAARRSRIRLDLGGTQGAVLPKQLAFVKLASGSRSQRQTSSRSAIPRALRPASVVQNALVLIRFSHGCITCSEELPWPAKSPLTWPALVEAKGLEPSNLLTASQMKTVYGHYSSRLHPT